MVRAGRRYNSRVWRLYLKQGSSPQGPKGTVVAAQGNVLFGMTEDFVQVWWLHRADKHRSGTESTKLSWMPDPPKKLGEYTRGLVCRGWCCWCSCCWCLAWPGASTGCLHCSTGTAGIRRGWAAGYTSWWISWYQLETNGQEPCSGALRAATKLKILYLLLWNSHQARKSCTAWPTTTKHRLDPAQMRHFPWVDRSPCSLLVWLTDPCSDVWDPANKIITTSQSQSCFVGTMSFLSSLHLWRKSLSCSQGRSHNLH